MHYIQSHQSDARPVVCYVIISQQNACFVIKVMSPEKLVKYDKQTTTVNWFMSHPSAIYGDIFTLQMKFDSVSLVL